MFLHGGNKEYDKGMIETRVINGGIRHVNKLLKHMRYNTFF